MNRDVILFTISVATMLASQRGSRPHRRFFRSMVRGVFGSSLVGSKQADLIEQWEDKDGEHAYLEDVSGEEAMCWVKNSNAECLEVVGKPEDDPLYGKVLAILDSKDKIPYLRKIGEWYFNFWQDNENPRGLWRRTTWESYCTGNPTWEVVLDIDALGKLEGESWVYKGHILRDLDGDVAPTRTMMKLSPGGSDAIVAREFDIEKKEFVKPEDGGFVVPEAKSRLSWLSDDILLVGTDFKDGDSLTDSGYPRTVHEWKRGTDLYTAPRKFEGAKEDVACSGYVSNHGGYKYEWRCRSLTFYTSSYAIRAWNSSEWHNLTALQPDADASQFGNQLLITLRSDWMSYKQGSLLAVNIDDFIQNGKTSTFTELFKPKDRVSLESWDVLKTKVVLQTLENVKSRISIWNYNCNKWEFVGAEEDAIIRGASISAVDSKQCDNYWLISNSFLTPSQMALGDANEGVAGINKAISSPIRSLKPQFNSDGMEEIQCEAFSKDGTKIPYFIIRKKELQNKGPQPTLMFGYGGFEISLTPNYAAVVGAAWLETGGVFVIANIRGGGEFGPQWHQAALKANRNKAYEDFIAVAEHLIETNVTTSKQLAIRGGSNGGLLMGNMLVRRPDLFGAVVCAVPLLDMKRYSHLLAGNSWMAEYGNPDTSDWSFLKYYSAYHNIALDAKDSYPPMLMTTSTKDDRVHPYHARSFVKRLRDVGVRNVQYYENIEGGHGGAADSKQQAFMTVLYIQFLKKNIFNF